LLESATALSAAVPAAPAFAVKTGSSRVAVIGAGAFGGWTALHLRRRGFDVTLLDAYGPGNARSSSAGGDSRVFRGSYGARHIYTQMVSRSLILWRENQAKWNARLLHEIGALFLGSAEDDAQRASMQGLREAGLPFEQLTRTEASKRFPQINFEGRESMILEKFAGYLTSRRACEVVCEGFVKEGGHYRGLAAQPGPISQNLMQGINLSDGSTLRADHYVFACGPWLGKVLPDVVGNRVLPTRQMGLFFGVPRGAELMQEDRCPVWLDAGSYYGIRVTITAASKSSEAL
jgi:glycine/D-amino acid oxidase-like deaminating enzyme